MIHLFESTPRGGTDRSHDPDVTPGFFAWLAALVMLAIVAIACAGCGSDTAGLPDDAFQAEADAVVALTFAADPVLPGGDDDAQPAPTPDDDRLQPGQTCPTCKGTGKSGDGRPGMCGVCSGDGRIDREDIVTQPAPQLADSPNPERIVYMYTLPNCPPCEAFKRVDIPILDDADVKVKIAKEIPRRGPAFRLYQDGEEVASVIGYVSAAWILAKFDAHESQGG